MYVCMCGDVHNLIQSKSTHYLASKLMVLTAILFVVIALLRIVHVADNANMMIAVLDWRQWHACYLCKRCQLAAKSSAVIVAGAA